MTHKSYVQGLSTKPLLGETVSENLKKTVEKYPNREALVVPYQNYRATYSEFWQQITQVAKGLVAYGVTKGDRVGIWSPNRFEWVLIQFATARIGAIMVNVNPAYKAQELKYALNQSEVSLLIMSKGFRQTNYLNIINHFVPVLPNPPAPRDVSESTSTSSHSARSCFAITNCATRSPSSILKSSLDKLTRITTISPL